MYKCQYSILFFYYFCKKGRKTTLKKVFFGTKTVKSDKKILELQTQFQDS